MTADDCSTLPEEWIPDPESPPLEQSVRILLDGMYRAYLAGIPALVDRVLAPDATVFDSAAPELVVGRAGLEALRASRVDPGDRQIETELIVSGIDARRVGDIVIAAYWLRVEAVDVHGSPLLPELSRNTAVLGVGVDGLTILHLHEDVWQPLGGPPADRLPGHT